MFVSKTRRHSQFGASEAATARETGVLSALKLNTLYSPRNEWAVGKTCVGAEVIFCSRAACVLAAWRRGGGSAMRCVTGVCAYSGV